MSGDILLASSSSCLVRWELASVFISMNAICSANQGWDSWRL